MKITKQKPIEHKKNKKKDSQDVENDILEAIKQECNKTKGRMDIRFLYSDGTNPTVHRFRINWWQDINTEYYYSEQRIIYSEFIRVIEGNQIKIERNSGNQNN